MQSRQNLLDTVVDDTNFPTLGYLEVDTVAIRCYNTEINNGRFLEIER